MGVVRTALQLLFAPGSLPIASYMAPRRLIMMIASWGRLWVAELAKGRKGRVAKDRGASDWPAVHRYSGTLIYSWPGLTKQSIALFSSPSRWTL